MKAILVLVGLLAFQPATAAELLLYDGVMSYGDSQNAFYWFGVPAVSPADRSAPDDYAGGQWHARYEIIDQPPYAIHGQPTGLQSCIWQDGKGGDYPETCGSVHFLDGPGSVEYTEEAPSSWWEKADSQDSAAPFDWARGADFVDMGSPTWHQIDGGGRCLATIAAWGGCEENMDLHLPMTIRISIVIVSSDSAFSGWEHYGFGDGEPDQDGGQDVDGGVELDGDGGQEFDADAGEQADADGGEQADADSGGDLEADAGQEPDADGNAGADPGQDAGGAGDVDEDPPLDGGCNCSTSAHDKGLCLLVLVLTLVRRRSGC